MPELVSAAIVEHEGNITHVARQFGVCRASVMELIAKRPALQSVLKDSRESVLDEAEGVLASKMRAGEAWAVCFLLKTQGKARGYVERHEVETAATTRLAIVEDVVSGDGHAAGPAAPGPG